MKIWFVLIMIRIYILKNLEERLSYFDEMKDSLSQSVLIAQDTAERVKQTAHDRSNNIIHQAEQDAHRLLEEAKYKANEILRQAADNAKKVAVETEELKNKSRVFHQRLKSTIESQLAIVDSSDWEEICVLLQLIFKRATKHSRKSSKRF